MAVGKIWLSHNNNFQKNIRREWQQSMKNQTLYFATQTRNGIIRKIGKSSVIQPRPNFRSDSVKIMRNKQSKADGK